MNIMKKVLALFLLMNIFVSTSYAADLVDDSIDGAIRTQYNTKKIEDDLLPNLPKNLTPFDDNDAFSPSPFHSQIKQDVPATAPAQKETKPQSTITNSYVQNNIKTSAILKSGKSFKVKIQGAVSDRTKEGTKITFVSQSPETFRYITIPAGTVFKGRVVDSHPSYLAGNGGLIVIKVDEMIYKGAAYEIDAGITLANGKHIFFNNIKGKRKFIQNMWNSTTFGSNFLKKMWRSSGKFINKGGLNILVAPFTLVGGVVVYGANVISSPVLALFTKGGAITIPAGSKFVIKLRQDAVILK